MSSSTSSSRLVSRETAVVSRDRGRRMRFPRRASSSPAVYALTMYSSALSSRPAIRTYGSVRALVRNSTGSWRPGSELQRVAYLVSAEARERALGDHGGRVRGAGDGERLVAASGLEHGVAGAAQQLGKLRSRALVLVRDQYRRADLHAPTSHRRKPAQARGPRVRSEDVPTLAHRRRGRQVRVPRPHSYLGTGAFT